MLKSEIEEVEEEEEEEDTDDFVEEFEGSNVAWLAFHSLAVHGLLLQEKTAVAEDT